MKSKWHNILFYGLLFGGGFALMYFAAKAGNLLELPESIVKPVSDENQLLIFFQTLGENLSSPSAILLVQIITILLIARVLGFVFKKIGQPSVIGEILAGILLGPSLVGYYFPDMFNFLFPAHSLENLKTISNIGLILFMFVVGMELDVKVLREKISESVAISQAGIIFPFALGMGLSYFLYERFVPAEVPFLSFALFVGVSMSITAFPVLARIAQERGLSKTKLGTVILACAAINDIMAWCILAVIIAIVKAGTVVSSLYTIAFAVMYVLVMFKVVRPFLQKISELYSSRENLNKSVVAVYFLVLLLSAFCTELIGIHALFGAFMAGIIMPDKRQFREIFVEKVEDVATVIFLPLFFVYTGLRTHIGLLNDISLWKIAGVITLVAITGKLAGSAIAARYVGRQSWRNSLITGTLMNTRGLMELVAINIGYDLGIISSEIFVMLVLMALITTFMTSPMLSLIERLFPDRQMEKEIERKQIAGIFKVMVSVGNPLSGKYLLRVAKRLLDGTRNTLEVTVLHITAGSDTNPLHSEKFSSEGLAFADSEAAALRVPLLREYAIANNVEEEIVRQLNDKSFDFLLIGAGISYAENPLFSETSLFSKIEWLNHTLNRIVSQRVRFYPQTLIKDKTRYFVENAHCSVGIFVNRNFHQITSTLIVISEPTDLFLLRYARRLLRNTAGEAQITLIDPNNIMPSEQEMTQTFENLQVEFPNKLHLSRIKNISNISNRFSFMLISYEAWNTFIAQSRWELRNIPSTLIISKKASRFGKNSE